MRISESHLRKIVRQVLSEGLFGADWAKAAEELDIDPKLSTVGDLRKVAKALESEKRGKKGVDAIKDVVKGLGADMFPMGGTILSSIEGLKNMYGKSDEKKTDTALDKLNIDDEIAKIVDDTVEDNFLKDVVAQTSGLSDDDPIPDMDALLSKWLQGKYDSRTVTGYSESKKLKTSVGELRGIIRTAILVEKKWSDLDAPKGTTIPLTPEDFEEEEWENPEDLDLEDVTLSDEIFDLIQNAYADVELEPGKYGNAKVQSPEDLPAGYTVMKAADIDGDPEPDYFRGGKMRGGRYKMGIVGHDGSRPAIDMYLEETAKDLMSGGIAEMSGKIAHIMITRYGVPAVTSKEQVESMLGKSVEWIGVHPDEKYGNRYGSAYEGWYNRGISGKSHMKILLGGA